jgi:hypothetical protein
MIMGVMGPRGPGDRIVWGVYIIKTCQLLWDTHVEKSERRCGRDICIGRTPTSHWCSNSAAAPEHPGTPTTAGVVDGKVLRNSLAWC